MYQMNKMNTFLLFFPKLSLCPNQHNICKNNTQQRTYESVKEHNTQPTLNKEHGTQLKPTIPHIEHPAKNHMRRKEHLPKLTSPHLKIAVENVVGEAVSQVVGGQAKLRWMSYQTSIGTSTTTKCHQSLSSTSMAET